MSGFSEDGSWWWDGTTWVATSQVVIPDLPVSDQQGIETMDAYRAVGKGAFWLGLGEIGTGSSYSGLILIPWLFFRGRAMRPYRASMLTQVATATAYLLGEDEPMIAGEISVYPSVWGGLVSGNLAVSVTRAHVLVLVIDVSTNRVRWVVLAARSRDVNIAFRWGFLWGYPTLLVYHGGRVFPIRGTWYVLQREPVLKAWREALAQPVPAAT